MSYLVWILVEFSHELQGLPQSDSWHRGEVITARQDAHLTEGVLRKPLHRQYTTPSYTIQHTPG